MAGIFNLLGGIPKLDKDQAVQSLVRSNTSLGISNVSAKANIQPKPKGLSIRSSSVSNVPSETNLSDLKQNLPKNKPQEYLTPKASQIDKGSSPISPRKEFSPTRVNVGPVNVKILSPKKEIYDQSALKPQNPFDDSSFKKPISRCFKTETYREPESLAPYEDSQLAFDDIYTLDLYNDFKELILKNNNEKIDCDDDVFELDSEQICPVIPMLCFSHEWIDDDDDKWSIPEVPDIYNSDDD